MGQSFFNDAEVPDHPDESDGASISLSTMIQPSVNGTCTKIGWRFPNTTPHPSIQVNAGLFRNSDSALLGSKLFPLASTPGQKNWVTLDTPIPMLAGVNYAVAIWSPNRYVASNGYLGADITRGQLTAISNGGRFNEPDPSLSFPTNTFGQSTYFVDLWFEPDVGGTTPFTKDVAVNWRVLNSFTKDVAANWRVLNGFTKDVAAVWRVLGGWQKDVSVLWDVHGSFVKDLLVRWRILSDVIPVADMTVNLGPQVINARLEEDITWDGR